MSKRFIAIIIGSIVSLVLLGDLIFLNIKFFSIIPPSNIQSSQSRALPTLFPSNVDSVCSSACTQMIKETVKNSISTLLPISSPTVVPTIQPTKAPITQTTQVVTVQSNGVKEFFVPLGSGTTTSEQWITLTGLGAQINPSNYQKIKSVNFEASLRIPTGNGRLYARLINVTDNVPLEETSVYVEGTVGQLVTSSFSLRSGNKTYGVQLRSTLNYEGVLDIARIKITTE